MRWERWYYNNRTSFKTLNISKLTHLIQIEDLFYNTPTRLSALRSSSDEYARILDVVTKYAVHNPTVSFSCKKVRTFHKILVEFVAIYARCFRLDHRALT